MKFRNVLCIILVIIFIIFLLHENYKVIEQMKETARTEEIYIGKEID